MEKRIRTADFFSESNAVNGFNKSNYDSLNFYINVVKAFARSTHQCVYIIDYYQKGFAYVSENMAYLCGRTVQEVQEMGYELYLQHVPSNELAMLKDINETGFEFFYSLPIEERNNYIITYDFHLVNEKRRILIHHQITPLVLTKEGRVWLALCTMSMSSNKTPGKIIMRKVGDNLYYEYSIAKKTWIKNCVVNLTEIEKDILRLSAQGYTMNDIAKKLCKSLDTVKGYKRSLFAKLEVKNITEAVSCVINYNLL